jgi:hypothetical protein
VRWPTSHRSRPGGETFTSSSDEFETAFLNRSASIWAIYVSRKAADSNGWLEFARFGDSSGFAGDSAGDAYAERREPLSDKLARRTVKTDAAGRS